MLTTPKRKGGLFLASSLCDGLEDNNIRQEIIDNFQNCIVLKISRKIKLTYKFFMYLQFLIRQVVTLLLNKDADPNILIPTHGVTPFHLVIGNDSEEFAEEVTKLFLRHGGNPNVKYDHKSRL